MKNILLFTVFVIVCCGVYGQGNVFDKDLVHNELDGLISELAPYIRDPGLYPSSGGERNAFSGNIHRLERTFLGGRLVLLFNIGANYQIDFILGQCTEPVSRAVLEYFRYNRADEYFLRTLSYVPLYSVKDIRSYEDGRVVGVEVKISRIRY